MGKIVKFGCLGVVGIFVLISILTTAGGGVSETTQRGREVRENAQEEVQDQDQEQVEQDGHTVIYRVSGSGKRGSMTYNNEQGGTEQEDAQLPWEKEYTGLEDGVFLYVSVQNQGESGSVICEIIVDGQPFKKSQSKAAYGIASCDGMLGLE